MTDSPATPRFPSRPNDPSPATRPTRAFTCHRSERAGFAFAHVSALRSFWGPCPETGVRLDWRAAFIGKRGSKASLRPRQMRQPPRIQFDGVALRWPSDTGKRKRGWPTLPKETGGSERSCSWNAGLGSGQVFLVRDGFTILDREHRLTIQRWHRRGGGEDERSSSWLIYGWL